MDTEILCYAGAGASAPVVADAFGLMLQTVFVAEKSICWLLFLIGSVPNNSADTLANLIEAEKRFPFSDLNKVSSTDDECKDNSEMEDDSDEDDDDVGDDDSDNDGEDSSGEDDDDDDDQGDPGSDSDDNNGESDDDDDEDDEDDDDDDDDEDDDDDDDDEDDEDEDNQPPCKKTK